MNKGNDDEEMGDTEEKSDIKEIKKL